MMAEACPKLSKLHSELETCLQTIISQGEFNHGHFHENVMSHLGIFDEKKYTNEDMKTTIDLFENLMIQVKEKAEHFAEDIEKVIATLSTKMENGSELRSKRGRDLKCGNTRERTTEESKDSDYFSADSAVLRDSRLLTEAGHLVTSTTDDQMNDDEQL